MITWSRVDKDGKQQVIKEFETLEQFSQYFSNTKDPEKEENKPEDGCWNCMNYDGDHCTKEWNNLDPCYYIDWRDDKEPDDWCDDWEHEPDAVWEDFFNGEEY